MTADPYGDEDLVHLYDLDNPGGVDHDYYRALADEVGATRIIDLGCGTGLLTRSLARPGRTVIGVDPSRTMLNYARAQQGADLVEWIDGDASVLPATADADLVISSGNAMMHLDPAEYPSVLRSLAAALRPGASISFESRNPAAREWEQWTREETYSERDTHVGRLREWLDVTAVDGERVVFDAFNVFEDGRTVVLTSVLYFRGADDIRADLEGAGFGDVKIRGGWRGESTAGSTHLLVFRATRL